MFPVVKVGKYDGVVKRASVDEDAVGKGVGLVKTFHS